MDLDRPRNFRRHSVIPASETLASTRLQIRDSEERRQSDNALPSARRQGHPQGSDVSDSDHNDGMRVARSQTDQSKGSNSTSLQLTDQVGDSDSQAADTGPWQSPTGYRLRTSEVHDPFLGNSVSGIAPTPFSFSDRNREDIAERRQSSSGTLSEEIEFRYKKTREVPLPAWSHTDNADARTFEESSTHVSKSEHPPRQRRSVDHRKRPFSEMGRQRAGRRKAFPMIEDMTDSDASIPFSSQTTRRSREDSAGHLDGRRNIIPSDAVLEKPRRKSSQWRDDVGFNTGSSGHRRQDQFTSSEKQQDTVPVRPVTSNPTNVPRVLRSFGGISDMIPDEERPGSGGSYDNSLSTTSPKQAHSPPIQSSSESSGDHTQSSAAVQRSSRTNTLQSHQGTQTQVEHQGRDSRQSSRNATPASAEQFSKSDVQTRSTNAPDKDSQTASTRQSPLQQRPLSPIAAEAAEESSSRSARTDSNIPVTVLAQSNVRVAERNTLPLSVEQSQDKAVQVRIVLPDKKLIACSLIAGFLAIALIAAVLYALLR
ncbi:uncharacterized protein LOC135399750 [Ornithodoros turicata]|uniref:uncharacterized protein LOC135399750 n=1 Tax=Ornithodoros turicata TaxID=34597 RepID=UPI003138C102